MDIKLFQKKDGSFTIGIENGQLLKENGLDTAIDISLFSDAEASSDRVQDNKERRGSMRDLVSTVSGRKHGSWLWLLNQAKLTPENRNYCQEYCEKALSWLVEDGIAKSIFADVEIIPRYGFRVAIIITYRNGEVTTYYRNLWEQTGTYIPTPIPILFNLIDTEGNLILDTSNFAIETFEGYL